jgi:NAD-dependent dihydropyrimidine dehydrogenase PreA subunit
MRDSLAPSTAWYYQREHRVVGPISAEELLALRDRGVVHRETLILPAGTKAWLRAESLVFLFPASPPNPNASLAALFNTNPLAEFSSRSHALTLAHVVPDSARCVQCGICSFNCPMGIDVRAHAWRGDAIYDSHCLICTQCVERCPRGVLEFQELAHYAED